MLQIVKVPAPVLSKPSRPISRIDKKVHKLIRDMKATLVHQTDPPGVGLAAPQVGVDLRLFIMKPTEKARSEVFINPEVVETQGEPEPLKRPKDSKNKDRGPLEGCLSIPRLWSPVTRTHKVLLSYTNEKGEEKKEWFTDFKAVIVQHEVDHLNGILFTRRALEANIPVYEEKDGELKKLTSI